MLTPKEINSVLKNIINTSAEDQIEIKLNAYLNSLSPQEQLMAASRTVCFDLKEAAKHLLKTSVFQANAAAENNDLLKWAIDRHDCTDLAKLLLEIPAVREHAAANNNALLRKAVKLNREEIVRLLLEIPAVRNNVAVNDNEILQSAVAEGNTTIVRLLLEIQVVKDKVELNVKKFLRQTPRNSRTNVSSLILEIPAVRDNVTANNNEILRWAVKNGYISVVKQLLEIPAVRDNAAANNNEALLSAFQEGHMEIAELLLVLPSVRDNAKLDNNEALRWVVTQGYTLQNTTKIHILLWAIKYSYAGMVRYLLKPQFVWARAKNEELIRDVLEVINEDEKESAITILLHYAIQKRDESVFNLLKTQEPFYTCVLKKLALTESEDDFVFSYSLPQDKQTFYLEHMEQFYCSLGEPVLKHVQGLSCVAEIHERKKAATRAVNEQYAFQPTVLDTLSFKEYLNVLKSAPSPLRDYFVLTGFHWTCGVVAIDKSGKAKILLIDPLFKAEGWKAQTCREVFYNPIVYSSNIQRQHDGESCALFSLDDVRHLHTISRYLENGVDLFEYLENNIEGIENGTKLVRLPLPIMRTMQSNKLYVPAYSEGCIMGNRPVKEREMPLGKNKGSANAYIQEEYKQDFLRNSDGKLVNYRLQKKSKKMERNVRNFLRKNLLSGSVNALEEKINKFSLSALREKLLSTKHHTHGDKKIKEAAVDTGRVNNCFRRMRAKLF